MEDGWHRDRGMYGHPCVVSKAWCLKGTLARGSKWAAWVQTAEASTISLTTDCWQSLMGSACGSRCSKQSNVIRQSGNSPPMKKWPVPPQRKKSSLSKKASSIRSEEHSDACLLMLTQQVGLPGGLNRGGRRAEQLPDDPVGHALCLAC